MTVQSGEQDSTVESLSSSLQPPENITIAIETRAVSQIEKKVTPYPAVLIISPEIHRTKIMLLHA